MARRPWAIQEIQERSRHLTVQPLQIFSSAAFGLVPEKTIISHSPPHFLHNNTHDNTCVLAKCHLEPILLYCCYEVNNRHSYCRKTHRMFLIFIGVDTWWPKKNSKIFTLHLSIASVKGEREGTNLQIVCWKTLHMLLVWYVVILLSLSLYCFIILYVIILSFIT